MAVLRFSKGGVEVMCEQELRRLSAAREVVRSLVLRALVGDFATVEAARLYYAVGLSPSEILVELGLPSSWKHAIRGRVTRLAHRLGFRAVARVLSEEGVYRRLLEVEPVVLRVGGAYRCSACGEVFTGRPLAHVCRRHADLVEKLVEEVLRG